MTRDLQTAEAFSTSWNNLPGGSVYTREQFEDWLAPLRQADIEGKRVLELGCGNGSHLVHLVNWNPAFVEGIDLGPSIASARANLQKTGKPQWRISQGDLVSFTSPGFDVVYCIGVLHHLQNPELGFEAVIRNTRPGGHFHCWVYAQEGNALIRYGVDPLRKLVCRFPWWVTKYGIATPLSIPFFLYCLIITRFRAFPATCRFPLYEYCQWISKREVAFFRHVAFDQLVTPQTTYLSQPTIKRWLASEPRIDQQSTYIIKRNGNSWKFGGQVR